MEYQFIGSGAELEQVCRRLHDEEVVCVDLEADSMHCFHDKICLIQIAAAGEAFLIDPFEFDDMTPFVRVLEDERVKKIFHGSDFDVRSLDREYGARIQNLFDTEIASRFLGIRERGLGALIKKNFDITLDKRFQKVDWSKRPLKPAMIEYSVKDVAYLVALHDILRDKLENAGRLEWAEEEFEIQAGVRFESSLTLPLFRKFKGAGKMDNRTLAVLENLLQLRLSLAEKKDRPLFKIMGNPVMAGLAEKKPLSRKEMARTKLLSPKQEQMYGEDCLAAIQQAMGLKNGELPSYPKSRRPRPDPRVKERIKQLKRLREKFSATLNIEPGFLLNNSLISAIAVENPGSLPDLQGIDHIRKWQVSVFGDKILTCLGYCRA